MTTSTRRFPVLTSRMTTSSPRLSLGTSSPSFVSLSRLVGSRRQREFDFYYHVNNLRTTEPQYGYCYWCIWNCRRYFQFYRPIETNSVFTVLLFQSVSRDSQALEVSLSKLDFFLSRLSTPFLSGNSMSHLDCEILPKLHHLRVAASVLKGYNIPASLSSLWRYLHQGYNSQVFSRSCPPDQAVTQSNVNITRQTAQWMR